MLRQALRAIEAVAIRLGGVPVERTVADALVAQFAPEARVVEEDAPACRQGVLAVSIAAASGTAEAEAPWIRFSFERSRGGELTASHARWLYAAFGLLHDEWAQRQEKEFQNGITIHPSIGWLRNLSDYLVGSLRTARGFDREAYLRQIARQGFTHVSVNGLGVPRPFESGPPGDVYSWFYDYSPDLDQFVNSTLLRGYYPPDYLAANLHYLKESAAIARRYGLTPGLHVNSPRSMPEEFWARYGFLRGARVDHPRETLRPRYTLAMAHPAVQRHYRELIQQIMAEIPDIGFIHIWTNDSGAGFEFVSSLYAGRNGGPYLIREWKSEESIARAAAANVLSYYRLLADEGKRVNPEFRLVCDLGPFFLERPYIIPGLGNGIDAGEFAYFEPPRHEDQQQALRDVGARTHLKLDLGDHIVPGFPYPGLVYERLKGAMETGAVLATVAPASLAPFDINGEVLRSLQLYPGRPLASVLEEVGGRWAGAEQASELVRLWQEADHAVRAYPAGVPMSTFGFPWFRLWVRPLVPDIDAVPEVERAYYERFLLATFNNPARIDLNNDMMWNFLTVAEAAEKKEAIDAGVLPPLDRAINRCTAVLDRVGAEDALVFADLIDRLRAGRCYYRTMRNVLAWIEAVHGYIDADSEEDRDSYRALTRSMVDDELQNVRELLHLWEGSRVSFMPVSSVAETLHIYGENFGDLLGRKIALMEAHHDDTPRIDRDFMWRMPAESG